MSCCNKKLPAVLTIILFISFPCFSLDKPELKWTADTDGDSIFLNIEIPEGYYQQANPELFYFVIEDVRELKTGEIIYPDVQKESEHQVYKDVIQLSTEILSKPAAICFATVRLHYQLCRDDGICFMPSVAAYTIIISN